jgi:hypothetical protein
VLRSAGVIPLAAEDVYSVRPRADLFKRRPHYAQLVAKGEFQPSDPPGNRFEGFSYAEEMVPFNFANLQDPVPASVYYDARFEDCWGKQSHCGTITDDTSSATVHQEQGVAISSV